MQFEWPAIFVNSILSGQVFLCVGKTPAIETNNFERWHADLMEYKNELEKVVSVEIYARIYRIAFTVSRNPEGAYIGNCQGELTPDGKNGSLYRFKLPE